MMTVRPRQQEQLVEKPTVDPLSGNVCKQHRERGPSASNVGNAIAALTPASEALKWSMSPSIVVNVYIWKT